MTQRHRVVIIGGGFGGLQAAKSLGNSTVGVTLIDRHNYHLFQPLLYQVATGALSPANIASPLRTILRRNRNTNVMMADVIDFDLKTKTVVTKEHRIPYDSLIVAAGARNNFFGNDQWEQYAPGLKSIDDARRIRSELFTAFEAAEQETDPEKRKAWLTFVIVGGGPTGVEMAGAFAEISRYTLRYDFRSIEPSEARIILIEASARILDHFPETLSTAATKDLQRLGVETITLARVTAIDGERVTYKIGETFHEIPTKGVVWTAGVRASELATKLSAASGVTLDRQGRVPVETDLSIPGYPDVMVVGDMARYEIEPGKPLPGVAPVAMQQGKYAAAKILAGVNGKPPPKFAYSDLGSMAVVGRGSAVAIVGKQQLTGFLGWLVWLAVHLLQIVQLHNRLLVLIQWMFSFFTYNRSARLITNYEEVTLPKNHS